MLPTTKEIGCKTLASQLASEKPPRLIDCREPDEFALCKIDGAELIPLSLFNSHFQTTLTDKSEKIIIYCHHGVRSLYATHFLRDNGFDQAYSLAGGIDQWSMLVDGSVPRY